MLTRKALIIYCDDTASGSLVGKGPEKDNEDYRAYLRSNLGGKWSDPEILSLHNPTKEIVRNAIKTHLTGAGYAFIVYTGHGCINPTDGLQYIELKDGDIAIVEFKLSMVVKQTVIIDACRTYHLVEATKSFGLMEESLSVSGKSTRELFDKAVERCETGWTILYAAGKGAAASTNRDGGLYLRNLIRSATTWKETNKEDNILTVLEAHDLTKNYIWSQTDSMQVPEITEEKRRFYFPFAVKYTSLYT